MNQVLLMEMRVYLQMNPVAVCALVKRAYAVMRTIRNLLHPPVIARRLLTLIDWDGCGC